MSWMRRGWIILRNSMFGRLFVLAMLSLLTACAGTAPGATPALDEPAAAVTPAAAATASPSVSHAEKPGTIERSNWYVTFLSEIPADTWSVGEHSYAVSVVCPDLGDVQNTVIRTFQVSVSATLLEKPIYLRPAGPSTGVLEGTRLQSIHPSQAAVASTTLPNLTQFQAELAAELCMATIRLDDDELRPLEAQPPYQR
jgi:hypothetical protein